MLSPAQHELAQAEPRTCAQIKTTVLNLPQPSYTV